ncbi:MAG: Hpt domain-containing protein [Verrucomicrobiales bacterium]|nr:Hpt domain-containing protein [Verrucomicrobiales bacterium]
MKGITREIFNAEEFCIQIIRPELRKQMIEMFPEEAGDFLDRAEAALKENDAERLHLAAHSLKGVVGNYLGTRAFSAATELDSLARKKHLTEAGDALQRCKNEVEILGLALQQFLEMDQQETEV